MASKDWQHPYVNIFKHVRVEDWKRSKKQGDVSVYMDKKLKCSVFRIRGPVPANSYILMPQNGNHSLGLTGRYFYLLFRPTPAKYFVVHMDVAAEESQAIRISFSNMFKEFKCTATWLQFPFLCTAAKDTVHECTAKSARHGLVGPAPSLVLWTCLMLDLQYTLSTYLTRHYRHLKSVKLCANMTVKNMFISDLLFEPGLSFSEAKLKGLACSQGTSPMPREMSFPVPKGSCWHDHYDYIRFPAEGTKLSFDSIQKDNKAHESTCVANQKSPIRESSHSDNISKPTQDSVSFIQQITTPVSVPDDQTPQVTNMPELDPVPTSQEEDQLFNHDDHDQQESPCSTLHSLTSRLDYDASGGGAHVYGHPEDGSHEESDDGKFDFSAVSCHLPSVNDTEQQLLPYNILKLKRIIGFGGGTAKYALWTRSGDEVVYPCHAVIVSMKIVSKQQRFFMGHSDKVSALTFNGNTTVLASAQSGTHSLLRVWDYHQGKCLAIWRINAQSLTTLSFSYSGDVLCGVGKDSQGKNMVTVWNTLKVLKGGKLTILGKVNTDVDIHTMKVTYFDDTRMASCGHGNVRLWQIHSGVIQSTPVDLGAHGSLDFTDVAFKEGNSSNQNVDDRTLYVSSRSGCMLEIDYGRAVLKNIRRLLFAQQPHVHRTTGRDIGINTISVSSACCVTGSEDGILQLWSPDFSSVLLEAEHEGSVTVVSLSPNSQHVLFATSTGNLGYLDVCSGSYNILMMSHTDSVLSFSVDGIRRHLATASRDGTIRLWDMDSMYELYDFVSEDKPCSVVFHPSEQVFSCGFSSGSIRVFDTRTGKILVEHKQHRSEVVGLTFSPHGEFMYSADAHGSLAMYNSSEEGYSLIRTVYNMVAQGTEHAPDTLTVSSDSRCLAFVGISAFIVTIADARSLDELLHVDISILDVKSTQLDTVVKVCFSPAFSDHLLVATSADKILWISSKTGRLFHKVSNVHKHQCSSLAMSDDGQFLLTAANGAVNVWDYNMQRDVNSQILIGHSQRVNQVRFTPDQLCIVSVGDAVFLWDFLTHPVDSFPDCCSPVRVGNNLPSERGKFTFMFIARSAKTAIVHPEAEVRSVQVSNGMPRQTAPRPSSPPLQLDLVTIDQEALGPSSVGEDARFIPPVSVPHTYSGSSSHHRSAASFLKITEGGSSPLNVSHESTAELHGNKPVRPDCYRHFIPRLKNSTSDKATVSPQPGEEGIKLKTVIGYNGNGRGNMVWSPDQGLFVYSCGSLVVVEYQHTGCQKHLQGHDEEVSGLALTHDAQTLASAAASSDGSRSLICIWNIENGKCRKTISYHKGVAQSLAFSRDDCLFLSVGDFCDPEVVLWSTRTFQLLSSVTMSGPIHDAAFSPTAATQLACVGNQGVYFCLIHAHSQNTDLRADRVSAPSEVGVVELTALSYHTDSILFTATNRGHVCAWDINTRLCIMTWEADAGEIGVLVCRGNRLLTGSNTCRLRLWEVDAVWSLKKHKKTSSVDHGGSVVILEREILLDGTLVSAAFDSTMDVGIAGTTAGTLWHINWVDKSSIRLVSGHKSKVSDVAFSSDERHFAACSEDGSLRVWLTQRNELVVQFQVLNQACGCVCWSSTPPGSAGWSAAVAVGYSDGSLRIFRLSSSEMEMKLHPHRTAVCAIQYSTKGHVILSAGKNGLVAISSPVTGATLHTIRDHKGAPITTITCVSTQCESFGLDGNELWLAASVDRRISVWAADWFKEMCHLLDWLTFSAPASLVDDGQPPTLAAFCPADPGLVVYTSYGLERALYFYNLLKKQVVRKIALSHWATSFSLSPNSQLIAVGSKERVLKLIKSTSGRFQDFIQHSDSVHVCRFSPSGSLLFTVAYNEILVWEIQAF
ncbi:WD repeat-containing protein 90 [Thalassophryne amazonica]|uniref:WD repeat-containing protein 90 n=1 Tax=Thalassophryne amazonica TaxID=390379 RepID=UPI00147114E3|nr:WD repeat-containing protein 90 [Thalassophryne amazonica]